MRTLLLEILVARVPQVAEPVAGKGLPSLSLPELKTVEEALAYEFTETGLRPDSEPNARGKSIDIILDAVLREIIRLQEARRPRVRQAEVVAAGLILLLVLQPGAVEHPGPRLPGIRSRRAGLRPRLHVGPRESRRTPLP